MVPNNARGTRVRCSYCGTMLMVPKTKPAPPKSRLSESMANGSGLIDDGKGKTVK